MTDLRTSLIPPERIIASPVRLLIVHVFAMVGFFHLMNELMIVSGIMQPIPKGRSIFIAVTVGAVQTYSMYRKARRSAGTLPVQAPTQEPT